jgi:Flp pilus assembly protein TadB
LVLEVLVLTVFRQALRGLELRAQLVAVEVVVREQLVLVTVVVLVAVAVLDRVLVQEHQDKAITEVLHQVPQLLPQVVEEKML